MSFNRIDKLLITNCKLLLNFIFNSEYIYYYLSINKNK